MPDDDHEVRRDNRQVVRLIAFGVIVLLIVLFVLDNTEDANVGFFFISDTDVPLILLIVVALVLGALLDRLFQWIRRR